MLLFLPKHEIPYYHENKILCRRITTRDVHVQVRLMYGCFTKETLGDIKIRRHTTIAP